MPSAPHSPEDAGPDGSGRPSWAVPPAVPPAAPPPYGYYGPPAGGPYQGWPAPPPPPAEFSGRAIAAFVLGLLAIVPGAIVCGVLALSGIRRTGQRGKGLAVAGLVLAGVWMVTGAAGVLLGGLYLSTHAQALSGLPGANDRPLSLLSAGTCYNEPQPGRPSLVEVVPCTKPHDYQLFSTVQLTGAYPGLAEAQQRSLLACVREEQRVFIDPDGLAAKSVLHYYYPQQSAWATGQPRVWCALHTRGAYPLTSSLLQSAADYTPAQRAYLRLVSTSRTLRHEVRDIRPGSWSDGPELAARLAGADRAEARALGAASARRVFTTPFLKQAAAQLAQQDVLEAGSAEIAAKASSSAGWWSASARIAPVRLTVARQTIRTNLGLVDS